MKLLRRLIFIALFVGLLVCGWMFAHGNAAPVRVDFLLGAVEAVALWKVLVLAVALGVIATGSVMGFVLLRLRLVARRYRRALAALESEVHQLRNLPLVSEEAALPADATLVANAGSGGGSG